MRREKKIVEAPLVTHLPDGMLTRVGALIETRKKYGDLGMISGDERLPRLVWKIGEFHTTVGRGSTWEIAISRCRAARREKDEVLDQTTG